MWTSFRKFIEQLSPVQNDEFEFARPFFREVQLPKGHFFIREGEICKQLAYLHKGILRSFYTNEKGEDVTYCFCTDHHLETSFKSFLLQQPSHISIQAMANSSLLIIEKEDLDRLFAGSLFWSTTGRLLTEREYLKMEEHASDIKAESAREKYLRLLHEHPVLLQKVPLQYIASYLGITSRHLTRLRKEIQVSGR